MGWQNPTLLSYLHQNRDELKKKYSGKFLVIKSNRFDPRLC
jgi:hypothetical protein